MDKQNAGIFNVADLKKKMENAGYKNVVTIEQVVTDSFDDPRVDPHITKFNKVEVHESGAKRDARKGKGRYDLISPIALRRMARLYERGCEKYGEWNWEKGQRFSLLMDSALRHLNSYREGMRDEDHLTQAAWNIFAMLHFDETKPHLNDLPKFSNEDGKYNG